MCVMVNEKPCLLKKSVIKQSYVFFNTKLGLLNKKINLTLKTL